MFVYLFPLLILSIFAYLEESDKFSSIVKNKFIYLIFFVIFVIFIGFRNEISCDWKYYILTFENISSTPLNQLLIIENNTYNFGFVLISKLFSYFTNFSGTIFLLSFLFTIPLFYISSKLKRTYLTLTISYPYYILVIGMGPLRQSLAISFLMLSIFYIYKNKYYLYFISLLISSTFHYSSILFNFLSFIVLNLSISKKKDRAIKFIFISIFLILIYLSFPKIANYFYVYGGEFKGIINSNLLSKFSIGFYEVNLVKAKGVIFVWLLNFFPSIIFLININKFPFEKELKKLLIIFSLFILLLLPFSLIYSIAVYRLLLYCFPSSIFITTFLPDINLFGIKKQYINNFIILFSIVSLFIWLKFAFHSYCWIPYKNLLFQNN